MGGTVMVKSDNARGAMFICVAMGAFTINDAVMKLLTETMPLYQAMTLRGVTSLLFLLAIARGRGELRFRLPAGDWRLMRFRALGEIIATVTYLLAMAHMPLATLVALMQSMPLATALAAVVIFRERLGRVQLIAILAGFLGVVVILRPGPDGISLWSLLVLVSVAACVLRDMSTRAMSPAMPTTMVAVFSATAVSVYGVVGWAFEGGIALDASMTLMLLVSSVTLAIGYCAGASAMRIGDVAAVAPFRYTSLIWAVVLDLLMFGLLPDAFTLIGGAIVIGAGLFGLMWERRARAAVS